MNVQTLISTCLICLASALNAIAEEKAPAPAKELPSVKEFDATQYLGTWYEIARLPTKIQPAGTLAAAQYTAGKKQGVVIVKNSAFDKTGMKLTEIRGSARLAEGDPPGRLLVSFGPFVPAKPNYYVMHVDEEYRFAVVGVPSRKLLWILAREVPVDNETLDSLKQIAKDSEFDVSKLEIAAWNNVPSERIDSQLNANEATVEISGEKE